jgi:hypothetical protein
MAKFTKSIRFGLTPWLFRRIRAEAKRQKVSVNELVRTAMETHLGELIWQRVEARQPEAKPKKPSLLDTPVVIWSPAEQEYAEKSIQRHFDEDR